MRFYKSLVALGFAGSLYAATEQPAQAETVQAQQALLEEAVSIEEAFEDEALLEVVREAIETNGHTELSLEALEEITELTKVRELGISSLSGMELLTGLTELEMRTNQISDLSPLSTLSNLRILDLRENNLSTLDGLESLTALKELDIRVNNVQDLSPISGLINLEALDIRDNTVTDLSPISGLVQLKELSARNNHISDLTPISNMTELIELNIHSNQISDLAPLTNLTKLNRLVARRNVITDISPLAQLTLLEDLNIRDNQIQDISPLGGLTNLTVRLNLDGNTGITDFSPIAHYYDAIEDVDFVLPRENGANLEHLEPLGGQERMDILTRYIIESNQYIKDPAIRERKLTNLAANPFAFYRGTAALFFQDVKNQVIQIPESWAPLSEARTWITGDLHVENIGFYGNRNKEAIFELNDFDEAAIAPFYFDMLNFGTSLYLLNDAAPGLQLNDSEIQNILESYSQYYRTAIDHVQSGQVNVQEHYFTASNLEGFVGDYMEEVSQTSLNKQLSDWTVVSESRQFDLSNNRLEEATDSEKNNLIDNWDTYLESVDLTGVAVSEDYFTIKDIARRVNAGLGSLGYDRYYVLIEGETDSQGDDIILDVKAQGPSAVASSGLVDNSRFATHAQRTITGVRALHNYPDIHWGTLETQDQSFLVKERTPFKDDFGPSDFSGSADLDQFVKTSAEATAYAHVRAAQAEGNTTFTNLVSSYFREQEATFDNEFAEVSLNYYAQVLKDHELYAELFAVGAFENGDQEVIEEDIPVEDLEPELDPELDPEPEVELEPEPELELEPDPELDPEPELDQDPISEGTTEENEVETILEEGPDDIIEEESAQSEAVREETVEAIIEESLEMEDGVDAETILPELVRGDSEDRTVPALTEGSTIIDNNDLSDANDGSNRYEQDHLPQTSYSAADYGLYGLLLLGSGSLLFLFNKKKENS